MTGPSGWKSPKKKPDYSVFPDEKPLTDYSGFKKENGRLTIIRPAYVMRLANGSRQWFYEAECSCGRNVTLSNVLQSLSCGCLRSERVAEENGKRRAAKAEGIKVKKSTRASRMPAMPKVKFDRQKVCIKNQITCIHYRECCDERLEGKPTSSRYQPDGGCYTAGRDERRYMEGIAP